MLGRRKELNVPFEYDKDAEGGIPPVAAHARAERTEELSNMYAAMRAKALGPEA